MGRRGTQHGAVALVAALLLAAVLAWLLAAQGLALPGALDRERASDRALAQAREALIAYAADRPIDERVGPGYLPCPDLDDDGWAEATCGSLSGDTGQAQRLGRLPWKTLGLPDLRDGAGERLWYAVSSKHKGLLNCAASAACVDMGPASALGTITVRDATGTVLHDGTLADPRRGGAAAVVIAPGAPLARPGPDGRDVDQRRECAPGDCEPEGPCATRPPQRAARCDPRQYLDRAPPRAGGEDNADFTDRNDAPGRRLNGNGFIQGPVHDAGRPWVNDRVTAISWADLMPRVMGRVALEVAHCLRFYGSRPENGGRLPWAAGCAGAADDAARLYVGRVPDTPFTATREASGGQALERWWRAAPAPSGRLDDLPTQWSACRIAIPPADVGPARTAPPAQPAAEAETPPGHPPAWWHAWRPYVTYALARAHSPASPAVACGLPGACLEVVAPERAPAPGKHFAVVVRERPGECGARAPDCDAVRGCSRLAVDRGEAHVASP